MTTHTHEWQRNGNWSVGSFSDSQDSESTVEYTCACGATKKTVTKNIVKEPPEPEIPVSEAMYRVGGELCEKEWHQTDHTFTTVAANIYRAMEAARRKESANVPERRRRYERRKWIQSSWICCRPGCTRSEEVPKRRSTDPR